MPPHRSRLLEIGSIIAARVRSSFPDKEGFFGQRPRPDNFCATPIPAPFCGVAFFAPRLFPFASFIYDEWSVPGSRELAGQSKAKVAARYFAVRCFFLASARRSVFFRRLARFLALSLPLLCPIGFKTHLLAPSRHVVVSTKTESNGASGVSDMAGKAAKGSGRAWWEQRRYKFAGGFRVCVSGASQPKFPDVPSDETEAGVCAAAAVGAVPAPTHPGLWSLADPALPPATWPLGRLLARLPRRVCS